MKKNRKERRREQFNPNCPKSVKVVNPQDQDMWYSAFNTFLVGNNFVRDMVSVQPMSAPKGSVFSFRTIYNTENIYICHKKHDYFEGWKTLKSKCGEWNVYKEDGTAKHTLFDIKFELSDADEVTPGTYEIPKEKLIYGTNEVCF